jgi:HK97 gp10 family phage protein
VTTTIRGLDDVNKMLGKIAPRQAQNIIRATVHGTAGEIRAIAKLKAPKDEGKLRRSIKTKRERATFGRVLSTVRVAPAAFYWRFIEYGDGPDRREHAMFGRAIEKIRNQLTRIFIEQFGKKWEAALARAAKRSAKNGA